MFQADDIFSYLFGVRVFFISNVDAPASIDCQAIRLVLKSGVQLSDIDGIRVRRTGFHIGNGRSVRAARQRDLAFVDRAISIRIVLDRML